MNESIYSGKARRMEGLKNSNGDFLFLAMDHQLSMGRIKKLDSYNDWLTFTDKNEISAIVLNKGALRGNLSIPRKSIILQTMGAPSIDGSVSKIKTATIEDAIFFDAAAISIQVNFEEKDYLSQLRLCVKQISKADEYGFPVLCMLNLTAIEKFDSERFIKYIKYCTELGCDLIKLPLPTDIDIAKHDLIGFIDTCPPLLLAGGAQNNNFILDVKKCKNAGFKGVCVGRNIFNSDDPVNTINQVKNIFCE